MYLINVDLYVMMQVSTMKLLLFLNLGVFGALVLLTLTLLKGTQRIDIAGMICATFAISVFAAPLSIIVRFFFFFFNLIIIL